MIDDHELRTRLREHVDRQIRPIALDEVTAGRDYPNTNTSRRLIPRLVAIGVVALSGVLLAFLILRDDHVERPSGVVTTQSVEVPKLRGLDLRDAQELLVSAGLTGTVANGDPTSDQSVVVALEPGEGEVVDVASIVGLRTATVNPVLCAGLSTVAEVDTEWTLTPPNAAALREAESAADGPILNALRTVVALLESTPNGGLPAVLSQSESQAVDRTIIHRRGCAILGL